MPLSRREFVRKAGVGIALSAAPYVQVRTSANPANERVRHAVIGTGGQGRSHCVGFANAPGCEVVAVCDVDPGRADDAVKRLPNGGRIKKFTDFRRLLEDQSIDSVSIATCDHWHAPIALAAMMSGKHVYVEKPCSHNVIEANLLVKAANEFKKCVQHGTQKRSSGDDIAGVAALNAGTIGRVFMAKAINHQFRGPIGRAEPSDPPAGVNYDLWLGPAPKHAFTRNRWHYNWHWFWDYGSGDLGNDGIHQLDVARWGLGVDYPDRIIASGAQLFYDDDHENPDTQMVVYEYRSCHLVYEMRLWTPYKLEGHENATIFYGTEGRMEFGRNGVIATMKDGEKKQIQGDGESNIDNFIKAVRAEDPSMLNAPITEGAISTNLCHLGNIGTRLGGVKLEYDPTKEEVVGNKDATALLRREYRAGYELPYTG